MATATSLKQDATPVAIAEETFLCSLGPADTTVTVTPTKIKAIESVIATCADAASAGAVPFVTSFNFGDPTVTLTSANNADFFVVVRGTIA